MDAKAKLNLEELLGIDDLDKVNGIQKARLAIVIAFEQMKHSSMSLDQKSDVAAAALEYFHLTVLVDFIEMLTGDEGKKCALLTEKSDKNSAQIHARLCCSIIQFTDEQRIAADRFRNLTELFK